MRQAVRIGETLVAPSVGEWVPVVGVGAPISTDLRLGWLARAGSRLEVRAPAGVTGVATRVREAGRWVAYGDLLVETGEGGVGLAHDHTEEVEAEGPPAGTLVVRADTDGTVFLAPEPGAPPFTTEGAVIAERGTLALVEVMKTFSPVRSPRTGKVTKVLVASGQGVSAGDPLFWIA